MTSRFRLRRILVLALLGFAASAASAQSVLFSDTFDNQATTNSLWSKNVAFIPASGVPSLQQDTSDGGSLIFNKRPTIFTSNLPSDYQGSISFGFASSNDVLSVGLRGSSTRDSGPYGAFYGVVLEFHSYLQQMRVVDFTSTGSATVLGSYSVGFDPDITYNFSWALSGTNLTVTQDGGSSYSFSGLGAGAGNTFFLNNSQSEYGFTLNSVSATSASAVPEPSTYAAFAGLAVGLVVLGQRSRQRRAAGQGV